MKSWAESVIRDSQMKSGYHTDLVHDEVRPNSSILSLPKFVSYSETKNELPDGRHRICWYLLDDAGHNHLAIVGNEKETRDGHYIYHTENIFDKVVPLLAYNQEEVRRWLNWIIGPRTEPLSQVLRMRSKMKTRPKNRSSLLRSRARGRGRHSRGGGHMAGAFTGSGGVPKKGKGAWRMYDLDFDARSVTTTELKKWLEEEVRIREKKKGDALAYVEDRFPDSEKEILGRSYKTLEKVRDELSAGKELGHDMLVDGISALREISHVRPSLKLASDDTFLALLKNIMRMGPDVMKNAVREILHHWLSSLVAHTQVMFDPTYVQDPRPSMEEMCVPDCLHQAMRFLNIDCIRDICSMKSPEFDQVVTRVTHRALATREDGMNSPFFSNSQEFEFATFTDTKSNEIRRLDKELEMSEGGRVEDKREPVESCATLQSAPSASLVEATNVMVDGDSAILPPFQQQMALEGIEY